MDSGFPVGRLAAHDSPGALRLDVDRRRWSRALQILLRIWREQRPKRNPLSKGAQLWLWVVMILDVVAIASMCSGGDWLDQTSALSRLATMGGHHRLILIMAVISFVMLAALAPLTLAFSRATDFELSLLSLACVISVAGLAGALSAILLLAVAGVLTAILALVGVLAAILLVGVIVLLAGLVRR
jgi:hypothetical protein